MSYVPSSFKEIASLIFLLSIVIFSFFKASSICFPDTEPDTFPAFALTLNTKFLVAKRFFNSLALTLFSASSFCR